MPVLVLKGQIRLGIREFTQNFILVIIAGVVPCIR